MTDSPAPTLPVRHDDPRVAAECVGMLYSQATTTFIGNLVAAMVLAGLFRHHVSTWALAAWLGATAVVLLGRFALARAFRRRRPTRTAPWGRWYGAFSLAVAACWAVAGAWLAPVAARVAAAGTATPDLKLFLVVLLLGISAAAVAALHPSPRLARGFLMVALGPPLAGLAITGGESEATLVALGAGYVLVMLRIAGNAHATLRESVALRFAASDIAVELERANREGESLNATLAAMRDAALDASRHKSEFLARMSHEIRTPLSGMLGMMELVHDAELGSRERRFLRTARESGEALLGIINDILDFSRIEAGQVALDDAVFDLRQVVEDVGALFAENAQGKGLELACALPAPGPCLYRGDMARLRQVLANLVGNAIKFTDEGSVQVRVSLPDGDDADAPLRFEVRDTGIGIPEDARERIFESFAQADGSTTRRYGGSGLGLAICNQLVRLMGGDLGVDAAPGRGSTFWFTLPLRAAKGEGVGTDPRPAMPPGTRVLVAVAGSASRALLMEQLRCWNVHAEEAADGTTAVARLRDAALHGERFHVLLLDRNLDGDGLKVARTVAVMPSRPVTAMLCPVHVPVTDSETSVAGIGYQITMPVRTDDLRRCLMALFAGGGEVVHVAGLRAPTPRFNGRVLLAEDSPVNKELAEAMLKGMGIQVDVVENGRDAVREAMREDYDLVLMDWQMPSMDGIEAAAMIRRMERDAGHGRRVPIVAVTANALPGDEAACLAAGMDGYMTKPFKRDELASVLALRLEAVAEPEGEAGEQGANERREGTTGSR